MRYMIECVSASEWLCVCTTYPVHEVSSCLGHTNCILCGHTNCMCVSLCLCMALCLCVSVYVCVCVYVCATYPVHEVSSCLGRTNCILISSHVSPIATSRSLALSNSSILRGWITIRRFSFRCPISISTIIIIHKRRGRSRRGYRGRSGIRSTQRIHMLKKKIWNLNVKWKGAKALSFWCIWWLRCKKYGTYQGIILQMIQKQWVLVYM